AAMRSNLKQKLSSRGAQGDSYVPFSSAQLENYERLMADEPLPLRNPRSGDRLDSHGFGQPFPYIYDSKTKTWTSRFHGGLNNLDEYAGKTWADFGFTDPATW
ncbi:MAG: hypothetical protein WCJ17_03255, partial [bacterium]